MQKGGEEEAETSTTVKKKMSLVTLGDKWSCQSLIDAPTVSSKQEQNLWDI